MVHTLSLFARHPVSTEVSCDQHVLLSYWMLKTQCRYSFPQTARSSVKWYREQHFPGCFPSGWCKTQEKQINLGISGQRATEQHNLGSGSIPQGAYIFRSVAHQIFFFTLFFFTLTLPRPASVLLWSHLSDPLFLALPALYGPVSSPVSKSWIVSNYIYTVIFTI